jgi:hypothetical protein
MMTFDPLSVVVGGLLTLLLGYPVWFFWWGAKHLHDAFVLPRILDWCEVDPIGWTGIGVT